ncbi:hypothetical protein [Massilia sp. DD77]|uniref:hypothetical protein n=1 Tax=Massilia sp. DD77 TaxID=3109349 RepID=UPI002FFE375C
MSTTHITPTIGRIVWYRGKDNVVRAAIVTAVHGRFSVNLRVFGIDPEDEEAYTHTNVTHADPEQEPGCFPSWHWMPYQKQQAEKQADAVRLQQHIDMEREAHASGSTQASAACAQVIGSSSGLYGSVRYEALQAALRTPGLTGHGEHLAAAKAYELYLTGKVEATGALD